MFTAVANAWSTSINAVIEGAEGGFAALDCEGARDRNRAWDNESIWLRGRMRTSRMLCGADCGAGSDPWSLRRGMPVYGAASSGLERTLVSSDGRLRGVVANIGTKFLTIAGDLTR